MHHALLANSSAKKPQADGDDICFFILQVLARVVRRLCWHANGPAIEIPAMWHDLVLSTQERLEGLAQWLARNRLRWATSAWLPSVWPLAYHPGHRHGPADASSLATIVDSIDRCLPVRLYGLAPTRRSSRGTCISVKR